MATYGNINDTFTAEVFINKLQSNYMIAHVKLGTIQLAIQSVVRVHDYCMYLHVKWYNLFFLSRLW